MPLIRIKNCINCDGASHEWEFTTPRLKELRIIQAKTGMNVNEFLEKMNSFDAEGLTALIDLLHRRSGVDLRWEDIDLDLDDFAVDDTAEEKALAEAAGKAEDEAIERAKSTD